VESVARDPVDVPLEPSEPELLPAPELEYVESVLDDGDELELLEGDELELLLEGDE